MDEIVALSTMLRARQKDGTSLTLDAIPHLTRSLPQVHADSTRLLSARVASTSPTPTTTVHPAALRLFATVGFEVDRLRRAISTIDAAATFIDFPTRTKDPHRHPTWLAPRAQDDARLSTNAFLRTAARDLATADLATANGRLREKLRANQLVPDPSTVLPTPRTPLSASANQPAHRSPTNTTPSAATATATFNVTTMVDERYVEAMRAIALHGDAPSAPFLMHEVAAGIPDNAHFVEMLAVVASVARHTTASAPSVDMSVWGARVVLEDQFAERIPSLPQKPRLAAPAAIIPAIADYVREMGRQGRLGNVGERPIVGFSGGRARGPASVPLWPQAYFCMRVGNIPAALTVLQTADRGRSPEAERVAQFLQRFLQGRDHALAKFRQERRRGVAGGSEGAMEDDDRVEEGTPMTPGYLIAESDYVALEKLYKEVAWASSDPFMRACFVLLLRLELLASYGTVSEVRGVMPSAVAFAQYPPSNKHQKCSPAMPDADMSLLFGSVEDYMWFRLWLCRSPIETEALSLLSSFSFVTYEEIQGNILSCGSGHFDPEGSQPLLYAFVLVCAGLYEEAVAYLTTKVDEKLMHPGIHLAIVLYHLRWNKDDAKFHSTLMRYTSLFSSLYPIEAAVYLMTIRDRQVLRKLLRELVEGTGEYETLLGGAKEGATSVGGFADLLSSATVSLPSKLTDNDLRVLRTETAVQGASAAASRGEFATAADLYNLAGKELETVDMVMRNLAEVVDMQSSPKRPLAVANARRMLQKIQSQGDMTLLGIIPRSLEVLLKMSTVFEEYWMWRFGTAWEAIRTTGVLPFKADDISGCQRDLSNPGDKYSACIQRCAGELLKVALIIAERALELGCVDAEPTNATTNSPNNLQSRQGQPADPNRAEIKSLCAFTGLMRITEAEVNERLVRVEMLLS